MSSRIIIIFFALNIFFLQAVQSQKLVKKIATEVCDCLNGLGDFLNNDDPAVALGKCFGPVVTKYEKEIRKEYGNDAFESTENKKLYNLGIEVGKVLATECPYYLNMFIDKESKKTSKAEEYFDKAEQLENDGDNDGAIKYYTLAIEQDRSNHEYFNARGVVYYAKEDYYASISDFLTAVRLMPDYKTGYYNMAYAKYQLDDVKNALGDVQQAIAIDSDYCDAYNLMGLIYNSDDDYENAFPSFKKAAECDPENPTYQFNSGFALYKMSNYEEALGYFLGAQEKKYDDADIYSYIGNCYDVLEIYDKAIECYTKYITGYEEDYLGYYNRGSTYFNKDEYQNAITDLQIALEKDSTDSLIFYKLGQCFYKLNRYEMALTMFDYAIKMSGDNASYYDARAQVYWLQGLYDKSIEDYKISLYLYPDDCKIYMYMSTLYSSLNDKIHADENWKKAQELGCKDE